MSSELTRRSDVACIAIGRNEGERLRSCLQSLVANLDVIIYVDSGSTDQSVPIAEDLGAHVVYLDTSKGFTAARARNAGFARLLQINPGIKYVQFIDGDCRLADGWINAAATWMDEHQDVAVVSGRRREIDPHRNRYHRLIDMEWAGIPGESKYCGGDAFMRVGAVQQVGGYRESLIAGEEPELCVRLRQAGWRVWRLDCEMTLHDISMTRFREWWKRSVRSGHAYTEGAALHGAPPERHWTKEVRSIWIWAAIFPIIAIALAWPTRGLSLLVLLLLYLMLFARAFRYRWKKRGDTISNASLYAGACLLAKLPQLQGSFQYWMNRLRKRQTILIEYRHETTGQNSSSQVIN